MQMKGRVLLIPSTNIRSVELFPVPDTLPEVVLQEVQRVVPEDWGPCKVSRQRFSARAGAGLHRRQCHRQWNRRQFNSGQILVW